MRPILILAVLPLALAACGERADDGDSPSASETAMPVEPDGGIGDGATPLPEDTAGISEGVIPPSLRGRWGLTAADCTSTRGDAKGLLTVSATTLTFYESVGRLDTVENRRENAIRAEFSFTGEGMSWTRNVALELQDGGDTLVRREYGKDAAAGPFEYTRCA